MCDQGIGQGAPGRDGAKDAGSWGPIHDDVTGLTVQRAGHFIPEEQPEAIASAILELAAR